MQWGFIIDNVTEIGIQVVDSTPKLAGKGGRVRGSLHFSIMQRSSLGDVPNEQTSLAHRARLGGQGIADWRLVPEFGMTR